MVINIPKREIFFNQSLDAPKAIRFLGRIFPQSTHLRGEASTEMLTHSPKTAQNIATALARYFISDNPNLPSLKPWLMPMPIVAVHYWP